MPLAFIAYHVILNAHPVQTAASCKAQQRDQRVPVKDAIDKERRNQSKEDLREDHACDLICFHS